MTRETSDCETRKPLAFDCSLRIARVLFGTSMENKSLSAVSLSLVSSEPLEFEFARVFFVAAATAAAAAVSALVFLVAIAAFSFAFLIMFSFFVCCSDLVEAALSSRGAFLLFASMESKTSFMAATPSPGSGADIVDKFPSEATVGIILANRPLYLGRLSASVFRHSYRIFLCPNLRLALFSRYRASCCMRISEGMRRITPGWICSEFKCIMPCSKSLNAFVRST